MAIAKRFSDSSQRLINRFGNLRTYNHKLGQIYNVESQKLEISEFSIDVKTFKTEPKERELKSPNLVSQETVVMLIAAADLTFAPKIGDKIVEQVNDTEARVYNVTVVKENWAAEAIVSWRLICIRG